MAPKKKEEPTKLPAVVKKARKEEMPAVPSSLADLMEQDAGGGMEGTDRDAFAIPFIRVLQQLSPQCSKGKTGYREDAEPGMIFNTVTNELIDGEEGIIFIPCAFQRRYIQWGADRGGFVHEWLPEEITKAQMEGSELIAGKGTIIKSEEDGKLYLGGDNPKKNDLLADTRSHFGLVLTANGPQQALLALSGSQVKKSKQLMGILSALRIGGKMPPTWMSKIKITTCLESNDDGSWHGIHVEHAGFIESTELYNLGKGFHDLIAAGSAGADFRAEESAEGKSTGKF